jgi:aryl-alcohol dehydrogenase-like predicted oxidoreductase
MRHNRLGSTGLFVSELCLGTMTFGGTGAYAAIGTLAQRDADALVGRAIEAGINFIDTADTYSEGRSERITGQALKNLGVPRDEVVVATKVFGETGAGPNQRGASRAHVHAGVRASLERLQLGHIDLYQLHGFDPATPVEETLRALDDLVRSGLVRYVGVSNWAAWQVSQALGVSALHGLVKFASLQAYYTLAGRDAERELIPMLEGEGLGMLVWSPLAGGFLSGKYDRTTTTLEGTRRAAFAFPPVDAERGFDVIDALKALAEAKHASVAQLAIAWLLQRPKVSSVIVGARRIEQLNDNLGAVDITFTADELATLDAASRLPAEYPGWMLEMWSASRMTQLAETRSAVSRSRARARA